MSKPADTEKQERKAGVAVACAHVQVTEGEDRESPESESRGSLEGWGERTAECSLSRRGLLPASQVTGAGTSSCPAGKVHGGTNPTLSSEVAQVPIQK